MEVALSNKARKFLDHLDDKKQKDKLREMIDYLKVDQKPFRVYDLKKMGGTENSHRLRKGKFRIEYEYDKVAKKIWITDIARRERIY
jgi:mRNA-degrading endonuclease RelE of RelBE toxin-antitoxin system